MYIFLNFQISFISVPCLSAGEASVHPALISDLPLIPISNLEFLTLPTGLDCSLYSCCCSFSFQLCSSSAYGCYVSVESYLDNFGTYEFQIFDFPKFPFLDVTKTLNQYLIFHLFMNKIQFQIDNMNSNFVLVNKKL